MVSNNFLLLSRRAYTVAISENILRQSSLASSAMKKKAAAAHVESGAANVKKQVFWMRDPKTGNYIPESHFEDVDVADLRNKLLSKKPKL